MTGTFVLTPAAGGLDLGNARVSIHSLLDETAGAGELVDRVAAGSVQLIARAGGKPTAATYESVPAGARPSFRMEMKQRSGGLIQFTLKVDRAVLSREPLLCTAARPSTTELVTRFAIEDDVHPALAIATTRRWECEGGPPQAPSELKLR